MRKLRRLLLIATFLVTTSVSLQAFAQSTTPTPCSTSSGSGDQALPGACDTLTLQGLAVEDPAVTTRPDAYGREVSFLSGILTNNGITAYTDISLSAIVFDNIQAEVGDGIGYLVNACGAGLLPDFTLVPGDSQRFEIPLELTEADAAIANSEVTPDATPVDAAQSTEAAASAGITRVSDREVVDVEWIDNESLRFGVGCDRALFTELDWSTYNVNTKAVAPTTHPHTEDITDALRQRLRLTDDAVFENSALTIAPNGERWVFQGETNQFNTAELDGSYARTLYSDLYNRTLQGILWLADNRLLAYYFGAYGDPVYYFTTSEQGTVISLPGSKNLPSITVPGASPDGRQAVIAGTFFEKAGYYLKSLVNNNDPQLLFEADPAGNNYPAPLFLVEPGDDPHNRVYIARPVDDAAQIQCYNLTEAKLYDLGSLPIQLNTDERAWWYLSPDNQWIALAANGTHGGLWMLALSSLPTCGI